MPSNISFRGKPIGYEGSAGIFTASFDQTKGFQQLVFDPQNGKAKQVIATAKNPDSVKNLQVIADLKTPDRRTISGPVNVSFGHYEKPERLYTVTLSADDRNGSIAVINGMKSFQRGSACRTEAAYECGGGSSLIGWGHDDYNADGIIDNVCINTVYGEESEYVQGSLSLRSAGGYPADCKVDPARANQPPPPTYVERAIPWAAPTQNLQRTYNEDALQLRFMLESGEGKQGRVYWVSTNVPDKEIPANMYKTLRGSLATFANGQTQRLEIQDVSPSTAVLPDGTYVMSVPVHATIGANPPDKHGDKIEILWRPFKAEETPNITIRTYFGGGTTDAKTLASQPPSDRDGDGRSDRVSSETRSYAFADRHLGDWSKDAPKVGPRPSQFPTGWNESQPTLPGKPNTRVTVHNTSTGLPLKPWDSN